MKKGYIIGIVSVLGVGILTYKYLKRPKAKIIINADGSGLAELGTKQATFEKGSGVLLTTWNGWSLSATSDRRTLKHYGKIYEDGEISQYDGGSSNVEIINNKI